MREQTIYERKGYKNRTDYLTTLADDNFIDASIVFTLAETLGETEDFDGLVNLIEDYVDEYGCDIPLF